VKKFILLDVPKSEEKERIWPDEPILSNNFLYKALLSTVPKKVFNKGL